MQDRTIVDPLRLVNVVGGLREPARIHGAKRGASRWPLQRLRLAAIVEACPHHRTGHKRPFRHLSPGVAVRQTPGHDLRVVGIEDSLTPIGDVLVAGHHRRGVFRAEDRLGGMSRVVAVEVAVDVVEAGHVSRLGSVHRIHHLAILGRGHWTRGVELLHCNAHPAHHLVAHLVALRRFFVEH